MAIRLYQDDRIVDHRTIPRRYIGSIWQVNLRADGILLVQQQSNLSIFLNRQFVGGRIYNSISDVVRGECLEEHRPGEEPISAILCPSAIPMRVMIFISQRYATSTSFAVPRTIGIRFINIIAMMKLFMHYEEDEPVFMDFQYIPNIYEISSDDSGDVASEDLN
jgi:hypothetical protein